MAILHEGYGRVAVLAGLLMLAGTVASAQQPVVTRAADHPVSAEIRAGVSTDRNATGPAVGGAVIVGLVDRLSVEGTGTYLGRGSGARAASVTGGLLFDLMEGDQVVPYVALGGGWYHSSLDLGAPRFFGNVSLPAGATVCGGGFGPGTCLYGQVPSYYRARLGNVYVPQNRAWSTVSFNDPVLHLGAGVRIALTSHVYVRPDARVLFAFSHGAHDTIGVFSLAVGFQP
ncbi:MAG: outer membrane beta-barrel protein [Acidobacteriota bacterium]|nr:outer membrane beta-barrel protein [Acidobacteriota bacterium]